MPITKPPRGSHGARPVPRLLAKALMPVLTRAHRRSGDRFGGVDLLSLSTVGARSGQRRTHPVARFDDGAGGWLVVASAGGQASHPAWYHNLAAHPDQVSAEVGRREHRVRVEQLEGEERARAWERVVARAPRFGKYGGVTDRELPVLRLTPLD